MLRVGDIEKIHTPTIMRIKKHIKKILILVLIIIVIYIIYGFGTVAGLISGIHAIQSRNNESVCDLFIENDPDKYYDENGYCVLAESDYDIKTYCYHGKYRIKGDKPLSLLGKIKYFPQKVLYYPIIRCW